MVLGEVLEAREFEALDKEVQKTLEEILTLLKYTKYIKKFSIVIEAENDNDGDGQ
jgi:hypothetical protein